MTSQHTLIITPASKDAILNSILENVRTSNAEMPLLINLPSSPLACREPPNEFEAITDHFSAQVHAFFHALHELENMSAKQPPDELPLIRKDEGLRPTIQIVNQSFDIYPDCWHRYFHTRRLTVHNPDTLPLLHRATQLRVLPALNYSSEPGMNMVHMRPVSPRVPLGLALRLPNLRELDCPWLWERLPVAFSSRALRKYTRVWEGPWRDARMEFYRAVRDVRLSLPDSFKKARLWFWKPDPYGDDADQAAPMPDLVCASSWSEFGGCDALSLGLRNLATCLAELDVRALITPNLFPSEGRPLSWPHMRHLKIEFHPCAPDGRWYFSGPRGEDPHPTGYTITAKEHYPPGLENDEETHEMWSREEDEYDGEDDITLERRPDMFRTCPINDRINPLLLAFATSLKGKIQSIQDADLFTWLTWRPSEERAREYAGSDDAPPSAEDEYVMFRWGVKYDKPKGGGIGKVVWQVGEDWRPANEVMAAFEDLVGEGGENMEWKPLVFVEKREEDPSDYM